MARPVDCRPGGYYAFRISVDLDGVAVRLRFRWLPAITRWTMIVETPAGEALTAWSVAQPGAQVLIDVSSPARPPGTLRWEGRETTEAADLGEGLRLIWTPQ